MKKNNCLPALIILFTCLVFAGCDGIKFMTDKPKAEQSDILTVTAVDDPQLAKLILKPKQSSVKVSRDPFKPLYDWSEKRAEAKVIEPVKQRFDDLTYIGMVRMGDRSLALIKAKEKKVMLTVNEQYRGFIVTEIATEQITLSDGVAKITLKRGTKK